MVLYILKGLKMNLKIALSSLPYTEKNVLSVLSGGLDSSVMTMMLIEKYGKDKVLAVSYDYGQKQIVEIKKAQELCHELGIKHTVFDLGILGEIAKPISANIVGTSVDMPTIKEVLGDPQPKTYVPFRNLILLSLTMAQAEANNAAYVFTGLQVHDEYGYWDTSKRFVDSVNNVASQNRTHTVQIMAPFSELSKYDEIEICKEMDQIKMLSKTLTCYNPDNLERSCGKCPSCAERIANFAKAGIPDPIAYAIDINWEELCAQ